MRKFFLYKYRGVNINTFNLLQNGEVFFSKPEDFNDIFEGTYTISNHDILADFISKIPNGKNGDIHKAGLSLFKKSVTQHKHEVRICCFSSDNDNQLMWGHYADSHKGICLQFRTQRYQKIKDAIHFNFMGDSLNPDKIATIDNGEITRASEEELANTVMTAFAWPVIYKEDIPNFAERNENNDNESYIPYFRIKNRNWEYEHEYRVSFEYNVLASPLVKFDKTMLSGVIFGSRTSEKDKEKIRHIVLNEYINCGIEVKFYQVIPSKDDYSLKIEML